MPTYVYETMPARKGGTPRRYEIRHSIKEPALTRHPETGEPIRRVLAGPVGLVTGSSGGHTHTSSCGCGAGGCGR